MSIPPLVCSTPPPPEQCEDDRDAEEFDIQYNLSQDDEDDGNDYNYGTYSDYIYNTTSSSNIQQDIWSSNISKKTDNKMCSDILEEKKETISILPKKDSSTVNKVAYEDIVLEDLNLKVENQNDEAPIEQSTIKFDSEDNRSKDTSTEDIDKNEDDNDKISNIIKVVSETTLVNDYAKTSEENIQPIVEETVIMEEYVEARLDVDTEENITHVKVKELENEIIHESYPDVAERTDLFTPLGQKNIVASEHKLKDLTDDDFGEFDDFQFISSENNPAATITYCDNPWDSEVSKNSDFDNFTATFDVDDTNIYKKSHKFDEHKAIENNQVDALIDETDDFGDFDDFKSSSNDHGETTLVQNDLSQNVPVLSLYSPDSEIQIIESINSVLSSIFTSEISELENDFEGKLESLLNETWGHLVDTDVRQSYIVNWNNSLGQKRLLKALCIDSRNILFGPKWNNNMPKYAVNLTVAPLQPQKPVTQTSARNADEQHLDKITNKETGTWSDPFTSDGKESCNSESQSAQAISRPANLDVFTNVMSPEMGHIYSSTLTVQPIRQINLPDTHIFTPTDSETPRSKTIHYDQGPAVLVPQPSEGNRQTEELTSKSKSEVTAQSSEHDEDYWEFQDFKGGSSTNSKNVASTVSQVENKSSAKKDSLPQIVGYETQILQPIKIVPITPALNWPDPGEVNETFDDFSDFISNTSWNNDNNTNKGNQPDSHLKICPEPEVLVDDFETFQSAPTLKSISPIENANQPPAPINHHNLNVFRQNLTEVNDKSNTTYSKADCTNVTNESLIQNQSPLPSSDNCSNVKVSTEKTSPLFNSGNQRINATVMQPSLANTSGSQRTQQKSGQILQPLSLESYSQINWPSPGIDLQDLSRFNPVESLQSIKTDISTGGSSKLASPAHKDTVTVRTEISDDDIWGDFVSSKPKQQQIQSKKVVVFADDDEWTDFVSSPSVKPQNGLNTISLNVHTNLNMQKSSGQNKFHTNSNQLTMDIPTLKYVTPKTNNRGLYNDKHFQNL